MLRDRILGDVVLATANIVAAGSSLVLPVLVDIQDEPQRAAWNAYRVASRRNESEPNLRHAAALVRAWNTFAEIMGLDVA